MHPYREITSESFVFQCEIDIALTHAASSKRSRIKLAVESLKRALLAAMRMRRPDLAWQANELLAIVGAS